jgi:hypothetical protein
MVLASLRSDMPAVRMSVPLLFDLPRRSLTSFGILFPQLVSFFTHCFKWLVEIPSLQNVSGLLCVIAASF